MGAAVLFALLLLQKASGQVSKGVIEHLSTNVDILCDLDRQLHPQYWEIQGRVYDLYSVPEIFEVRGHEAIRLATVDRRMDGWTFRCFTIVNKTGLELGMETRLDVFPNPNNVSSNATTPLDDPNLLRSSLLGRLVLHYQKLQLGLESTTLSWLYTPHSSSPCNASGYRVNIYTQEEISNAESQIDPVAHRHFNAIENNITIPSHFFKDHANSTNFFRVSALQNSSSATIKCADAAYFNNFTDNNKELYVNQSSLSFIIIPEDIQSDIKSIQLIWSKDSNTQCVCPPVEEQMSRCACNVENMNRNFITISNNTVTISNLTQDMDEGELRLYLVSSVSSGCNLACNLRSIIRIYRLNTIPGDPLPPQYNTSGQAICLDIPINLIAPEVYEVNLTDSTGSRTRLSGVYNTSQCLNITSDLYPTVCGPFQISVAAVNSVGRHVEQHLLLLDNQPMPCDCFKEKEKFSLVTTTSSTSAELTLICQLHMATRFLTIFIETQIENSIISHNFTVTCNETMVVKHLIPSSNYSVSILHKNTDTTCSLDHFRTNKAATATTPATTSTTATTTTSTTATTTTSFKAPFIAVTVVSIVSLIILLLIFVVYCIYKRKQPAQELYMYAQEEVTSNPATSNPAFELHTQN